MELVARVGEWFSSILQRGLLLFVLKPTQMCRFVWSVGSNAKLYYVDGSFIPHRQLVYGKPSYELVH